MGGEWLSLEHCSAQEKQELADLLERLRTEHEAKLLRQKLTHLDRTKTDDE